MVLRLSLLIARVRLRTLRTSSRVFADRLKLGCNTARILERAAERLWRKDASQNRCKLCAFASGAFVSALQCNGPRKMLYVFALLAFPSHRIFLLRSADLR